MGSYAANINNMQSLTGSDIQKLKYTRWTWYRKFILCRYFEFILFAFRL